MNFGVKTRVVPIAAVIAMAAVLITLGVLQYRWSLDVSNAEAKRMQETLERSLLNVRLDVNQELKSICVELEPNRPETVEDARRYSDRVTHWRETAAHPALVSRVFVWAGGSDSLTFVDPGGKFQKVEWPSDLGDVRARLQEVSSRMPGPGAIFLHHERGRHGHFMQFGKMPGPEGFQVRAIHVGGPGLPWAFSGSVPALIHPIFSHPSVRNAAPPKISWLIVQLDPAVLERTVIPEAFQRNFATVAERGFDVGVIGGGEKPHVVYSSSANFPSFENFHPDASLNLFGFPGPMRGPGDKFFAQVPIDHNGRPPFQMPDIEIFSTVHDGPGWQLIAEHRSGSVEAAVSELRRRNLALAFGVLTVLAGAMTTLIVSTQRASRLAQLQMEFVAGVSHELRTPLTVICSAAENIVDGLVREPQHVEHYGSVIKQQAGQLKHLIEQILSFASRKDSQLRHQLRLVNVGDAIDLAVGNTAEFVGASGFVVAQQIDQQLPPVLAHVQALSQCLQNLITNATKYSPESKWIGIRATTQQTAKGPEVVISVEDRGIGISPDDLKHIFEPFYRGALAHDSQIHGSGLGLPLARSIAESMGGTLTVESTVGKGSCFAVHLPAQSSGAVETEATRESQMMRVSPGLQ